MKVDDRWVASTGPGAVSKDGCAVDVYLRLPAAGEPQLVHRVAGDGGSILDLGAGVGRIADPLVELGHLVVAVDESADMLSHVRLADTVHSDIETLRLDQRFDVVLLASHLINTPDEQLRGQLLASVAHHLVPDGRALIQWHRPEWFDTLQPGRTYSGEIGELHSELQVHSKVGGQLSATVRYQAAQQEWTQKFRTQQLTTADMADCLDTVGLEMVDDQLLTPDWLLAQQRTTALT